ncbi:MAG: hypothetical protein OEY11_14960, partial [Gammaproteobacteria bacterium]|nr:hypothetical protein [Gammaproteobacteria bacterium]
IWRRTDSGFTERGKEYLAAGTGWLGNYNSGVFARATAFSWSLPNAASGHTLVEYRDAVGETYNEDVAELTTTSMVLLRQQDGVSRHFTKQ